MKGTCRAGNDSRRKFPNTHNEKEAKEIDRVHV